MKNKFTLSLGALALSASLLTAQTRYLDEVFSDADITVMSDQVYGINFSLYVPASLGGPQLIPQFMDIYMPNPAVDQVSERPVIIYLHTGSFLPKGLASPMGEKTDSAAVEACRRFARMGYVTISATYRVGWLANSTNLDLRRGTNLLAVYNAVQDVKACVRALRGLEATANPFETDMQHVALVGQGSGGYITLAYASLDKLSEIVDPDKFKYEVGGTGIFGQSVSAGTPYVDTNIVGDWNGYGGKVTLTGGTTPLGLPAIDLTQPGRNYQNTPGLPDDVSVVVNMGGALGDSAWLEAGATPMISVHCRYDFFAPYYRGMVQVPVGGQFFPVVDVVGSYVAIKESFELGNNAFYLNGNWNDALSVKARNNVHNVGNYNNLLTFNIPPANPALPFAVNSNPWDWWDPADPLGVNETNPNIKSQSMAYIDTVMDFIVPRIAYAFKQNGLNVPGLGEEEFSVDLSGIEIYPNPAQGFVNVKSSDSELEGVVLMDITGKEVRRWSLNGNEARLNLEGIRPGMYILQVKSVEGQTSRRLSLK